MLEVFRDHKIRGPEPVETGSWRVCTFQSASFLKLVCNIIEFNCSAKLGLDQNQNMTKDLKSTAYKQLLHKKCILSIEGIAFQQVGWSKNNRVFQFVFQYAWCASVPHYKYKPGIYHVPVSVRVTVFYPTFSGWWLIGNSLRNTSIIVLGKWLFTFYTRNFWCFGNENQMYFTLAALSLWQKCNQ